MKYKGAFIAILIAAFCRLFLISVYKIPFESMAPSILAGDFILASQISYGFKFPVNQQTYFESAPVVGDLVVYSKNGRSFIKRVVAIEGAEVEYSQNELVLNGQRCSYEPIESGPDHELLNETCLNKHTVVRPKDLNNSAALPAQKVPPNQVLVAGDNRIRSENNPTPIEVINNDQIVGKPVLIWMSYRSTQDFISNSLGIRWNRILTIPK